MRIHRNSEVDEIFDAAGVPPEHVLRDNFAQEISDIYVPKDQHGRLKIAAIESETTIEELILHGIQLVLKVPTSKPGRDRRRSDGK